MSQQNKTLGQIAYEEAAIGDGRWPEWELVSPKDGWERIAAAVAAAVKEEDARIIEVYGLNLCHDDKDMQRVFERSKPHRETYAAAIRASIKEGK